MAFHPLLAFADLFRLIQCLPRFRQYRKLQEEFGFDPWHVKSPFQRRPYKRRVVEMANGFKPQTVVEIGCGLGELIARSTADYRFGFDQEAAVIAAAKHLHGPAVTFATADLRDPAAIAAVIGRPVDVLVMVNWPHMLALDDIKKAIDGLQALIPVRTLIIDTIYPDRSGYQHYHKAAGMTQLGRVIATISGGDAIRDIHAIALPSHSG